MTTTKTIGLTSAAASVALAVLLSSQVSASAQTSAVDQAAHDAESPIHRMHKPRPLTVRRRSPEAVAAAPAAAGNIVTAPLGVASTIVGLPFQAIGGVFGGSTAPRAGGVTNVRYQGAGAEEAKLDEGFAMGVPVDKSGPIYVVKNGDPTVNPLSFIGAPIAAAGTLAQAPFQILGAPFGGPAPRI